MNELDKPGFGPALAALAPLGNIIISLTDRLDDLARFEYQLSEETFCDYIKNMKMEQSKDTIIVKEASIERFIHKLNGIPFFENKENPLQKDNVIMAAGTEYKTSVAYICEGESFLIDKGALGQVVDVVFQVTDALVKTKEKQRVDLNYIVTQYDDVCDLLIPTEVHP